MARRCGHFTQLAREKCNFLQNLEHFLLHYYFMQPFSAKQHQPPSSRPLPGLVPLILLCGVLTVSWAVTPEKRSQAPSAPGAVSSEALADMVSKLKSQQDVIVANQTKIEAQTEQLKEQVRQAKIFAARIR
jgi:hypothetical protein